MFGRGNKILELESKCEVLEEKLFNIERSLFDLKFPKGKLVQENLIQDWRYCIRKNAHLVYSYYFASRFNNAFVCIEDIVKDKYNIEKVSIFCEDKTVFFKLKIKNEEGNSKEIYLILNKTENLFSYISENLFTDNASWSEIKIANN